MFLSRGEQRKPAMVSVATLLDNFAGYSARATREVDADAAFLPAPGHDVCIGLVCAGTVLAGSDLIGAPRRLATRFADLSADIMSQFTNTLGKSRFAVRMTTEEMPCSFT
jgi:hypothetical protein